MKQIRMYVLTVIFSTAVFFSGCGKDPAPSAPAELPVRTEVQFSLFTGNTFTDTIYNSATLSVTLFINKSPKSNPGQTIPLFDTTLTITDMKQLPALAQSFLLTRSSGDIYSSSEILRAGYSFRYTVLGYVMQYGTFEEIPAGTVTKMVTVPLHL